MAPATGSLKFLTAARSRKKLAETIYLIEEMGVVTVRAKRAQLGGPDL
jgi:hypothetical protein